MQPSRLQTMLGDVYSSFRFLVFLFSPDLQGYIFGLYQSSERVENRQYSSWFPSIVCPKDKSVLSLGFCLFFPVPQVEQNIS